MRIIPADNEAPYYFNVLSRKDFKEKYDGQKDVMAKAYVDWFSQLASEAGVSLGTFLSDALLPGMQTQQFRALTPETAYVFFTFGVDYSGNLTTDVETYEFTPLKPQLKKDAKIAIELLQAGPTWFKVKFDCSDPDIFYYYDVMEPAAYEYYCDGRPEGIVTYMTEYLKAMKSENDKFNAMSMAEFITALTVSGEVEYDTALSEAANSLFPEMEYPVFAIGIANDGSFTTDPVVVMVSTTETEPNDWIVDENETRLTDISYSTVITPKWDEVYAVILECSLYFEGLEDQAIVDELLAARRGTFIDDLYMGRLEFTATNLIPDEDYELCLIACTPDGLQFGIGVLDNGGSNEQSNGPLAATQVEVRMGSASMTAEWAPVAGAYGYRCEVSYIIDGQNAYVLKTNISETSFNVTALRPKTTFTVRVAATDKDEKASRNWFMKDFSTEALNVSFDIKPYED